MTALHPEARNWVEDIRGGERVKGSSRVQADVILKSYWAAHHMSIVELSNPLRGQGEEETTAT